MSYQHQLLVEGSNDQRIFKKLLGDMNINNVNVLPPSKVEEGGNGVDNLIKLLPATIKTLPSRGDTGNRLAIVVDADYPNDGGYENRREKICKIISNNGYTAPISTPSNTMKGEIFKCQDTDMPPIGLWIMPNHHNDGMMEDLIFGCINHENSVAKILKNHAEPAIDKLFSDAEVEPHLFNKKIHLNKIRLETWIKWQIEAKSMGHAFSKDGLFNMEHENIKNLKDWLKRVFVDEYDIEN